MKSVSNQSTKSTMNSKTVTVPKYNYIKSFLRDNTKYIDKNSPNKKDIKAKKSTEKKNL